MLAEAASPSAVAEVLMHFSTTAESLFGPSMRGQWAMLAAKFDESGTHPKSPIFVVAGLVAPPVQWERLTVEWQRVLDAEGLPDFHMKDYVHSRKHFAEWKGDEPRRDGLMRNLVRIITKRVDYRVWAAIDMAAYRQLIPRDTDRRMPYSICASLCASVLRDISATTHRGHFIPYMFEQGGHGSERVFRAFDKLMGSDKHDFYRMSALTKGKREKFPCLQAADLHAYEVHKYFADQVHRTQPPRFRNSFRELMKVKDAGGYLMVPAKLSLFLEGLLKQEAEGKPGQFLPIPRDTLSRECRVVLNPSPLSRDEPEALP